LRLKLVIAAVIGCFIAAMSASAQQAPKQEAATLEFKFRPGEVQRFKTSMRMQMNVAMPGMPALPEGKTGFEMNMSTVVRQKTLGVLPDGSAKVSYTYETIKVDTSGLPMADKTPMGDIQKELKKMPPITVTMTKHGQITDIQGMQNVPGMPQGMDFSKMLGGAGGMGSWSFAFPVEGVSVGDAWTQDVPIMGAGKMSVDSTLVSLNTLLNNQVVAKIKQNFAGRIELGDLMKALMPAFGANSSQMPSMGGGMDMSGWGVAYFDRAKGRVARSDANIDMVVNMTMAAPPGMQEMDASSPGQSINISMTMKIIVNLAALPQNAD
jgi:hypothetical protein